MNNYLNPIASSTTIDEESNRLEFIEYYEYPFYRYVSLEEKNRLLKEDDVLIESLKSISSGISKKSLVIAKKSLLTSSFLLSGRSIIIICICFWYKR
jgi:hypothetical protein